MDTFYSTTEEQSQKIPLASIIIVTYNHKNYIVNCLNSVLNQSYPHEIILVDNCSSDGTYEIVEKLFPSVKIIKNRNNSGYGAANNIGVKYSKGDVIVILNPDTIAEEGWLENLVYPLIEGKDLISTPKILNYDGSEINTCGNINHFTGLTFTQGLGENPNSFNEMMFVSGVSGACFALRKSDFEKLNGFDESFFLYNEDSDFSWRIHLSGLHIIFIPTSVIYHDYTLKVSPEKLYHLEKGRYLILRKCYTKNDLVLISPALFFTELMTSYYALKLGKSGISNKFRAIYEGLNYPVIRLYGDRKSLFKSLHPSIPPGQLTSNKIEFCARLIGNYIFSFNYRVFQ